MSLGNLLLIVLICLLLTFEFILILNLYILLSRKNKLKIWNFGKLLTNDQIREVLLLLNNKFSEMEQNVMIIIYGAKWQMYILEFVKVVFGIIFRNNTGSYFSLRQFNLARKKDFALGIHSNKIRLITINEFLMSQYCSDEKKVLLIMTIIHELRHHYHFLNESKMLNIDEELECGAFSQRFIADNFSNVKDILQLNKEIDDIKFDCDVEKLVWFYKEYYKR